MNVVNLLASQWGRLFTNVGDVTGRVGVVEDDTIVYVGTENRNHMLGHMSMLGTQGFAGLSPCAPAGPTEAAIGDPDFVSLAEWALENKRKGGVVIRPHFPYCGYTEDPVFHHQGRCRRARDRRASRHRLPYAGVVPVPSTAATRWPWPAEPTR